MLRSDLMYLSYYKQNLYGDRGHWAELPMQYKKLETKS